MLIVAFNPETVTWVEVTSTVETTELSDDFFTIIFPDPLTMASLKVMVSAVKAETPVASSAGDNVAMVGGVTSAPPPVTFTVSFKSSIRQFAVFAAGEPVPPCP